MDKWQYWQWSVCSSYVQSTGSIRSSTHYQWLHHQRFCDQWQYSVWICGITSQGNDELEGKYICNNWFVIYLPFILVWRAITTSVLAANTYLTCPTVLVVAMWNIQLTFKTIACTHTLTWHNPTVMSIIELYKLLLL